MQSLRPQPKNLSDSAAAASAQFLAGLKVHSDSQIPPLSRTFWFVYALPKAGKSTLAIGNPDALVVDFEGKAHLVPQPLLRAKYVVPQTMPEVLGLVDYLVAEGTAGRHPFKMIVLDTLDELLHGFVIPYYTEELRHEKPGVLTAYENICDYKSSEKGSGGWNFVTNTVLKIMRRLRAAGYGIMVLGHQKTRIISQKGRDTLTLLPAVNQGLYLGTAGIATFVATMCTRSEVVTTEETVVFGGKELTLPKKHTASTRVLVTVMRPPRPGTESDGIAEPGSAGQNVRIPPEIVLSDGDPWGSLKSAYETSVASLNSKGRS